MSEGHVRFRNHPPKFVRLLKIDHGHLGVGREKTRRRFTRDAGQKQVLAPVNNTAQYRALVRAKNLVHVYGI